MAEDIMWKEKYTKLKERYAKLEEGRNALRQGLSIFEQEMSKMQADNHALKKAFEDEKARADTEKGEKERESAMRVSLENEVCALKSEIQAFKENGNSAAQSSNEEVLHLEQRVSDSEKEINQLKELLGKERVRADIEKKRADSEKKRADSEKKKADTDRKKADETLKNAKAENNRVQKDKMLAETVRKKAEEYRVQLEALKNELDEVKSKLAMEKLNFEEMKKKLEDERRYLSKEKTRADIAIVKAEDQRKLAEGNRKMAMDEKNRAHILTKQLEEEREKVLKLEKDISELVSSKKLVEVFGELPDKQIIPGHVEGTDITKRIITTPELCSDPLKFKEAHGKLVEARKEIIRERKRADSEMKKAKEQKKAAKSYEKKAEEEKHRVDKLCGEVEDNKHRIEKMQSLIEKLVKSPIPVSNKSSYSESAKVKLLREKLKLKKMLVKHAKQVAELEVARNQILRQELCRLKQEFLQLSQHLDILDNSVLCSSKDISDIEKVSDLNLKRKRSHVKPHQMHLFTEKEVLKRSGPLSPVFGGSHTESISGIDSNLEPPLRGSNQKMLQSSAINSRSASFSDRPLVGSQEGGAFSVTTSDKITEENSNLEHSVSRLLDGTRKRCRGNLAALADNNIKSHTHLVTALEKTDVGYRNEELLGVDSVENLYSKGKKWHKPVAKILSPHDQPLLEKGCMTPHLQRRLCNHDVIGYKRRRISCEEAMVGHICDSGERKKRIETSNIKESDIRKQSPPSSCNPTKTIHAWGELDKYFHDQDLAVSSPELVEHDYMKLLDLDNDVDEKSYRIAMDRPLSPTLPVIEFKKSEILDLTYAKNPVNSFHGEFPNVKENFATCDNFDVMDLEIDSNRKMKLHGFGSSRVLQMQEQKGLENSMKNLVGNENGKSVIVQMGNPRICEIRDSGSELRISEVTNFEIVPNISCESVVPSSHSGLPRYCVVSSDTDHISVSRIFGAIINFKSQCSIISSSSSVRDIMVALLKAEELSSQEKVCTFVSILLQNLCEAAAENLGNVLETDTLRFVNFLHSNLNAAFSQVDSKTLMLKLFDSNDLLDLVEDFLLSRRVLVYGGVSAELTGTHILNGTDTVLSVQAAPSCLLVAGSVLLASICQSINHVGFICEASFNIFRIHKLDFSFVLIILHVFAYVCGAKYFAQEDYGLLMTVVRSLVLHIERLKCSNESVPHSSSLVGMPCKLRLCSDCPFFEDKVSTSSSVSQLLEELQNYIKTAVERQHHVEQMNPSNASAKSNEVDYLMDVPSDDFSNQTLSHFFEILSLVELVAYFMSWDWSFDYIVSPILNMLESCVLEHFAAAVITLLGQIGRFGIDADGYENTKVDNLRGRLSAMLSQIGTRKCGILIQLASATALVNLLPFSFEELVNTDAEITAAGDCLKKWFSSLSIKQQSAFKSGLSSIPGGKLDKLLPQVSC